MFLGMVAAMIAILVIMSYMSTSSIVVDASKVKIAFEKIKNVYVIEKILVDSVEHLCQSNAQVCKDKEVSGVISLNIADLSGYIPSNFVNDNLYGGLFSIEILNNYTTIRINHYISDPVVRNVYIHHNAGAYNGIPPKCVDESVENCGSIYIYHDFATSLQTRAALEI